MEYYKDLLKEKQQSKLRLFIGILFFAVSIAWITMKMIENKPIETFDWVYSGIFLLNALIHILGAVGYPFEGLFGKAFIQIDNRSIRIKSWIFEKEQSAVWDDIQSIEFKMNQLLLSEKDDSCTSISLSKLEYLWVQEIKDTLRNLASKKDIHIKE